MLSTRGTETVKRKTRSSVSLKYESTGENHLYSVQ